MMQTRIPQFDIAARDGYHENCGGADWWALAMTSPRWQKNFGHFECRDGQHAKTFHDQETTHRDITLRVHHKGGTKAGLHRGHHGMLTP